RRSEAPRRGHRPRGGGARRSRRPRSEARRGATWPRPRAATSRPRASGTGRAACRRRRRADPRLRPRGHRTRRARRTGRRRSSHEHRDRDAAEKQPEHELQAPLVDARERARAESGADDRAERQHDRVDRPDLAGDAVGEHAREADRDDRSERCSMRIALAVARPEHEQRHHHDAPAHAEQAGEEAAEGADRHEPRIEAVREHPATAGARREGRRVAERRVDAATIAALDPVDKQTDPNYAPCSPPQGGPTPVPRRPAAGRSFEPGRLPMKGSLRRFALLATALAVVGALPAAVAGAERTQTAGIRDGGTLTIGLAEEPDALDPTLARTFVGRMVFLSMCEKLYDLDKNLNIVPQLAAALPQVSKDKLTYTIKLRPGIKFNDGTSMDAAAVKASLDRDLTLKGSVRASEISPVKSVSTSGASTVVLHLSAPYSPLTSQLADRAGMVMSPKALDAEGANFAQNPVCVGPFMFKDRVAGDHITLVKSPYYYDKSKVHFASIVYKIMTDPSSRTQALRAGDIQVEDRIQSTDVPTLQKDKSVSVAKAVTIGYQGLTFNVGNKSGVGKPYSNVGTPLAKSQFIRT